MKNALSAPTCRHAAAVVIAVVVSAGGPESGGI